MNFRFYISPATDLPHIFDHGISEDEVYEVFASAPEHLHAKQGAWMAVGQTYAGRHLRVIYRKERGGIYVITAYDLGNKALRAARRRRRKNR